MCEKPTNRSFIKLYDVFISDKKMYIFMEEHVPTTLYSRLLITSSQNVTPDSIEKWAKQQADAYAYMHNLAIAHLNIRTENIIFDAQDNIKVAGLSRCFLYFK